MGRWKHVAHPLLPQADAIGQRRPKQVGRAQRGARLVVPVTMVVGTLRPAKSAQDARPAKMASKSRRTWTAWLRNASRFPSRSPGAAPMYRSRAAAKADCFGRWRVANPLTQSFPRGAPGQGGPSHPRPQLSWKGPSTAKDRLSVNRHRGSCNPRPTTPRCPTPASRSRQPGVSIFVSDERDRIAATCMLVTAPNLLRGGPRHGFLEKGRRPS